VTHRRQRVADGRRSLASATYRCRRRVRGPANDNFNALLARPKGRAYNNFTKNSPQCTEDLKCCFVENS